MKKIYKIAVASVLALPVVASAAMTNDEMLNYSSEQLKNAPVNELKLDELTARGNGYEGYSWDVEYNGKEYKCIKPGFAGFWVIGGGCHRVTYLKQ
ncbi:hypothetical protein [Francisella philomiragia]|uniref:hypothetical protein n=1 Tax=Francisella philomiragia TaxID=28110 RepID=UPI001B8D0D52|nr:hypothetical protein [Francisella philomiragia]QUE32404.1 hypothetical protein IMS64_09695 [Francisella philomiragia]